VHAACEWEGTKKDPPHVQVFPSSRSLHFFSPNTINGRRSCDRRCERLFIFCSLVSRSIGGLADVNNGLCRKPTRSILGFGFVRIFSPDEK
jgi:hypothetical protein